MYSGWIFTVGKMILYTRYLKEIPNLKKAVGGSVFLNRELAEKYCGPEFSVYLVKARWGIDTKPNECLDFHDLLIEANIYHIT